VIRPGTQHDPPSAADLERGQAQVHGIAPPSERVSWLHLTWEPGEEGDPVERYVVWQMVPPRATAAILWADGQRLVHYRGRWIPDPRWPLRLEVGGLSATQRRLYRGYGCYAQPFWIVQGTQGGHKRRFSEIERKILRLEGLPDEPPIAGELPYAPVDERVLSRLRDLDQLSKYSKMVDFAERRPFELENEEKEVIRSMRSRVLDWLESQIDAAEEEAGMTRARWQSMLDQYGVSSDEVVDVDEERERFLSDE
jgi:hypothetical protein